MEVKDHAHYLCVACGMPTLSDDESTLRCDRCRREYPVVDGIPLLVLRPRALLDAAKKSLRAMEARIAELERMLDGNSDVGGIPASGRVRAERTLRGLRVNGKLIRDHLPTGQGMSERVDEALQLVESVANWGAAWPADAMIPYFYQDWGHTEQFETVRKLVVEVLRKHRSDRAAVAILGAGACGLVQAVADEFDRVYGVDLSIPR
jgi:uncharacterized protein YbaR (Trm112 family)